MRCTYDWCPTVNAALVFGIIIFFVVFILFAIGIRIKDEYKKRKSKR